MSGNNSHQDANDDIQDTKYRKLYANNMKYETTAVTHERYFEKWGEVVDSAVILDPTTKKSRGFGGITYKTADQDV